MMGGRRMTAKAVYVRGTLTYKHAGRGHPLYHERSVGVRISCFCAGGCRWNARQRYMKMVPEKVRDGTEYRLTPFMLRPKADHEETDDVMPPKNTAETTTLPRTTMTMPRHDRLLPGHVRRISSMHVL